MRKAVIIILSLIIFISLGIIINKVYLYNSDNKFYSELHKYKPRATDFKEDKNEDESEVNS